MTTQQVRVTLGEILDELGASDVQRVLFEQDPEASLMAIARAQQANARSPVSYALKVLSEQKASASTADSGRRTNAHAPLIDCPTCAGDRFVVVRKRPKGYEEVAPCPACNPIEVAFYRADGSVFRSMDADSARAAIR